MNIKHYLLAFLIIFFINGCSKDDSTNVVSDDTIIIDDDTNDDDNNDDIDDDDDNIDDKYSENRNLILPNSDFYFIADVYIDGVHKKLNMQSGSNNCYSGWGSWFCKQEHKEYYGVLTNTQPSNNPTISARVGFRGECPSCTFNNLVSENLNYFTHSSENYDGIVITLSLIPKDINPSLNIPLRMDYTTQNTPLSNQNQTEFILKEILTVGTSGKAIVVNFECNIKNDQLSNPQNPNGGATLEIRNAVLKTRIGV